MGLAPTRMSASPMWCCGGVPALPLTPYLSSPSPGSARLTLQMLCSRPLKQVRFRCLEPKSCVSVQKPHCIARGKSHPQATVYCNGAIPWQGLITQQGAITRHMLTMHAGPAGRLNIRWNLMVTMFVFSCSMLSVCLASGHIDSVCIHQIWTSVVSASKPRHTSCEYWPCSSLVSLLHACYLGSLV